jgi:hypothetical protein
VHAGVPIIPVIENLKDVRTQVPAILKKFNAIEIGAKGKPMDS